MGPASQPVVADVDRAEVRAGGFGRPRSRACRRPMAASRVRRGASTSSPPRRRCTRRRAEAAVTAARHRHVRPVQAALRPTGPGPQAIAAWRLTPRPDPAAGLFLVDRHVRPPSWEMRIVGLRPQAVPGPRCWYTTATRSGSVGCVATTGSQARSSTDFGMMLTAVSWATGDARFRREGRRTRGSANRGTARAAVGDGKGRARRRGARASGLARGSVGGRRAPAHERKTIDGAGEPPSLQGVSRGARPSGGPREIRSDRDHKRPGEVVVIAVDQRLPDDRRASVGRAHDVGQVDDGRPRQPGGFCLAAEMAPAERRGAGGRAALDRVAVLRKAGGDVNSDRGVSTSIATVPGIRSISRARPLPDARARCRGWRRPGASGSRR